MQDSEKHGTGDQLLRLLERDGENGARSLAQVPGVSPRAIRGFCRAELAVFQAVQGEGCTVRRSEHLLAGARRCSYVFRRRRRAR